MSLMTRAVALLTGGLLTTTVVFAWAETGSPPKGSSAAAPGAHTSTVRGVIKSVSDRRLVLDTGQPGPRSEVLLALDEGTVVQKGVGKPIKAKELKAGDPVTVSYTESGGKAIARRVWIRSSSGATPASPGKGPGPKTQ